MKPAVILVLSAAIGWNCWEGARHAYSFTIEDTRTQGKEWIDQNISPGSKVLIDSKVNMPPILMSYDQLKKFHDKAITLNHYKKEYFALQLDAHPGPGQGYEIVTLQRNFRQIGSLEHQVKEIQQLQDLQEVSGDLEALRKRGIQYVITNNLGVHGTLLDEDKGMADFYRALEKEARLLKVFEPRYPIYHGGPVRIYKL